MTGTIVLAIAVELIAFIAMTVVISFVVSLFVTAKCLRRHLDEVDKVVDESLEDFKKISIETIEALRKR